LIFTAFLANEYFAFRVLLSAIPKWSHHIKNKFFDSFTKIAHRRLDAVLP